MNFTIDPENICSITLRESRSIYANIPEEELTSEQLAKILTGEDRITMISSVDHPEFNNLRCRLEEGRYIIVQRSWCNGDWVVKEFTLNGWSFKPGDRFLSAAAMAVAIHVAEQLGSKTITW